MKQILHDMSDPTDLDVVLALHGSASTGKQWRTLAERLCGTATVVAPDLPGYGTAARDAGSRVAMLEGLIAGIEQPVHIVAHSFGGAVALRLAHDMPDRVASLTLYDPLVVERSDQGHTILPSDIRQIWNSNRRAEPEKLMQAFLDYWAGTGSWARLAPKQRQRLIAHAPGLRRDFLEAERGLWMMHDPYYQGPISVICGGHSPRAAVDMTILLTHACPQTRHLWLPGHGHLAPLTDPGTIASHFQRELILNGCGAARSRPETKRPAA